MPAGLRWALARDGVVVAHSVDADAGMIGADYRRVAEDQARRIVAEALSFAAELAPGRPIEGVLLDGPVAWALTEYASDAGDLLVIGTHKTGFLRGRVLGSRSVEVALLARCDVLVVPETDLRFRSGVVAGVTGGPETTEVVETAARIAAARGDDLLLVHGRSDRNDVASVLFGARRAARAVAPGLTLRTRASDRGVAELLLDAGRDRALIVIGERRDRSRSPIGSVIHDVLLNLTAPTLVVHAAPVEEAASHAAVSGIPVE